MGKAGKKQKRGPRIKDKKQSERFKEAAREHGADQPSEDFDKVLESLAKITQTVPEAPQLPVTTQLQDINCGGIAKLANGTRWRIAPNDLSRALTWSRGTEVVLRANEPGKAWSFTLTNVETGDRVAVLPAQ
jgi:hypothetical protein